MNFIFLAFTSSIITLFSPHSKNINFFDQSINHHGRHTFKQRFYSNEAYYKPNGPIILYLGGESMLKPSSVTRGLGVELAKRYGGLLLSLEHRYYGISQPFKNLKTKNLRYLSSKYALKDIAKFIKFMNHQLKALTNNKNKPKWILMGGSYPANLAAWARLKYPNLVYASLASSAPVEAKEDFYEYDLVVGKALGEQCRKNISEFIRYLDAQYQNKPRFEEIKEIMGCSDIKDDKLFLYVFSDILSSIVQYNSPSFPFNIKEFCEPLEASLSDEEMLKIISSQYEKYLKLRSQTCYKFSGLDELMSNKLNEQHNSKQWTYQSCTEFGYWQTAPKDTWISTRSKYLTANWFNNFYCSQPFYDFNIGPPKVHETNSFYGGKYFNTTRVIFTNGDLDPWSTLSITNTNNSTSSMPIFIIKNGSHVNDFGSPSWRDSKSLNQTRESIFKSFDKWIYQ